MYDSTGTRIATGGDSGMVRRIPALPALPSVGDIDRIPLPGGLHLRYTTDTVVGTYVVAAATTDRLRRGQTQFVARMLLMAPLALILALTIGYLLTRVALAPIDALGRAADAISPGDLAGRLPVNAKPDELDHLAMRFNGLLDRIQALQEQSHRFLREVAHQIRTPLTLVLGEAELGLERDPHRGRIRARAAPRARGGRPDDPSGAGPPPAGPHGSRRATAAARCRRARRARTRGHRSLSRPRQVAGPASRTRTRSRRAK